MAPVVITQKLADFLEGGQSMLVATRSAGLEPAIVRGFGAEVDPDRANVVVFFPEAVAAETLENLRASSRIAITFARTHDHRTFQIKGDCVAVASASDAQRTIVESYRSAFGGQLDIVGVPRRLSTAPRKSVGRWRPRIPSVEPAVELWLWERSGGAGRCARRTDAEGGSGSV